MGHIGQEALVQKGKTPLFIELTTLFQKALDTLLPFPKYDDNEIWIALNKIKFEDQAKQIIAKTMGSFVSKVQLKADSEPNLYCAFEISQPLIKRVNSKTVTSGIAIEKIRTLYNDRSAKIDTQVDQDVPYKFFVVIHTAMLAYRNFDNSFYFTAEELAAFVLHEIGHFDHWLRTGLRLHNRVVDACDVVDYLQTTQDLTTVKLVVEHLKIRPKLMKDWGKVLTTVEKYLATNPNTIGPEWHEAIDTLCLAFIKEASFVDLAYLDENLLGLQKTNVSTRLQNRVDMERSADEFAARNGAYAAMASGLQKIHAVTDTHSYIGYRRYVPASLAVLLGGITAFGAALIPLQDINMGYDSAIRRMKLVLETAKHAFAQDKMSAETRADINKQIQEVEALIKEYEASTHYKTRKLLQTWVKNVTTFGRLFESPFTNRLSKSYEQLQDTNRKLTRHPLYYLAQKQ